MALVAEFFGKTKLREVPVPEFYGAISKLYGKVPDRAILRAMHFFADNERAQTEADALERGDFNAFLALINESGRSSWMLLQNIYPSGAAAQPAAVALACCEHLLAGEGACRIHGGGFAGTIQAFVPLNRLEAFRSGIESVTGQGTCRILAFRNIGSTEILL
jgi:galactokinase